MILGLLTGTHDQAANSLRQAQRQPAAQAQTNAGHGGEGPDIFPSGKNPFEKAIDQLLRIISKNYNSKEFMDLRALRHELSDLGASYDKMKLVATNRRPWDIKRDFPDWVADNEENPTWITGSAPGTEYNRDIWGNIHFGYLGAAAGFWLKELNDGAGITQYKSHINNNPAGWEKFHMYVVELFGTWDEPADQRAIEIGYSLWNQFGYPLPKSALMYEIRRRRMGLNIR